MISFEKVELRSNELRKQPGKVGMGKWRGYVLCTCRDS